MTKWLAAIVLATATVGALGAAWLLPYDTLRGQLGERGPIELATTILWFGFGAVCAILTLAGHRVLFLPAFLSALAGARELDAHARFTGEAVTNLRYWTDETVSSVEKLTAAAILIAILAIVGVWLRRYWRAALESLVRGDGAAWSAAVIFIALPILVLADGTARYYAGFTGTTLDPEIRIFSDAVEEIGEMMLPVLAFLALGQFAESLRLPAGPDRFAAATPDQPRTADAEPS